MPLHIGRVESEIEVTPAADGGGDRPRSGEGPSRRQEAVQRGLAGMTDGELRERLRPIVVEILETELARFQRQNG